ncbi:hypothetical protein HAX54_040858 [Datura stramonium]|uniref:Uncharacterized protein n=1 Tax=Datura stramonium TaxID=4076 RepID=A0ABS8SKF4_DATST|nr:hypothetical protein [Datura stramonium]
MRVDPDQYPKTLLKSLSLLLLRPKRTCVHPSPLQTLSLTPFRRLTLKSVRSAALMSLPLFHDFSEFQISLTTVGVKRETYLHQSDKSRIWGR